jgi:TetR/AcrR family transcriptional repressor of bet genes
VPKLVDHDQRREEVAEAAWRVIGRDGLEGATLREIAREAGFTTGVIQHYFRDRDELLAFAARLISEQAVERQKEAVRAHPPGRERLVALLEILVPPGMRAARVAVLLGFWARAATDPRHNAIYLKQYARLRALFREQVAAAMTAGALARGDIDDMTDHLIAFGDGLCVRAGLDPERYPQARRRHLIEHALDAL